MDINNQITIFIVDDNKLFSSALKMDIESTFVDMPIRIFSFETGEKCLEAVKNEKPHIVILDYFLNNMYPEAADGVMVLGWIKNINPEIKVIMLTSEDNIDIALKSFHLGASDYVVKSETQFKKINYSLLNIFKILEANNYAKKSRRQVIAILLLAALIVGGVFAIQIL